ncbi:hypothetical protein SUDANB176_00114 [Streptomyces sp. enrichment culture]|uniref:VOC family protein n=1 Tax=Streptomyces sp. enrichment culture TaxID=1795815 RepID=UPI003F572C4A
MPRRPVVHLAVPVDDLIAARGFHGQVPTLPEGRSTGHWVDWNLRSHQLVTHLVPVVPQPTGTSLVGHRRVPIPHFGLPLDEQRFHRFAGRLRAAGVRFDVESQLRFPDEPGKHGEQWTVFFRNPEGNALESKAFRAESMVFA